MTWSSRKFIWAMPFSRAILPRGGQALQPQVFPHNQLPVPNPRFVTASTGTSDVRSLVAAESQSQLSRQSSLQHDTAAFPSQLRERSSSAGGGVGVGAGRSTIAARVHSLVMALALCHRFYSTLPPFNFLHLHLPKPLFKKKHTPL